MHRKASERRLQTSDGYMPAGEPACKQATATSRTPRGSGILASTRSRPWHLSANAPAPASLCHRLARASRTCLCRSSLPLHLGAHTHVPAALGPRARGTLPGKHSRPRHLVELSCGTWARTCSRPRKLAAHLLAPEAS